MAGDLKGRRSEARRRLWSNRLRRVALGSAVIEALLIPLAPAAATIVIIVGVLALLVRLAFDKNFKLRLLPFDVPAILFCAIALASVVVSPDIGFSFYNYYNLVGAYAATYFLVGQSVQSVNDIKKVMIAMLIASALVIIYGFYQYIIGIDTSSMRWVDGEAFPELQRRVFSTWENPNILAGYLDVIICMALGVFGMVRGTWRTLLGAIIALALICLGMTYARGATLVIAAILLGYGTVKDWRILLIFGVIGVAAFIADPVLADRMMSVFSRIDTSMEMRLAFWESTMEMIADRPLLGVGWGAFYMVYPAHDYYLQGAPITIVHAHNMYLNYMAEIGLLGAIAFFWFLFGSMSKAFSLPKDDPDALTKIDEITDLQQKCERLRHWQEQRLLRGLSIGIGLAFISIALNGLTDHLLFNIPSSMLFWYLAALIPTIGWLIDVSPKTDNS